MTVVQTHIPRAHFIVIYLKVPHPMDPPPSIFIDQDVVTAVHGKSYVSALVYFWWWIA